MTTIMYEQRAQMTIFFTGGCGLYTGDGARRGEGVPLWAGAAADGAAVSAWKVPLLSNRCRLEGPA